MNGGLKKICHLSAFIVLSSYWCAESYRNYYYKSKYLVLSNFAASFSSDILHIANWSYTVSVNTFEGAVTSYGDVGRYVIIRDVLDSIFNVQ
jgi:hypothetical protein